MSKLLRNNQPGPENIMLQSAPVVARGHTVMVRLWLECSEKRVSML